MNGIEGEVIEIYDAKNVNLITPLEWDQAVTGQKERNKCEILY